MLSEKMYTILKWSAIVAMPALSTLVAVVFKIWSLPYGDAIAQTITAFATFVGALLCVSTANYNRENDNAEND